MTRGIVQNDVDVRQWEVIFRDRFVQIPVVNTHPYFSILLRNWNYVG